MAKCAACGRFLSAPDGAKCGKCPAIYHRPCVGMPDNAKVSLSWICPSCKPKKHKGDNLDTPIKALNEDAILTEEPSIDTSLTVPEIQSLCELRTSPRSTSQINIILEEIKSFRNELGSIREEIREYRKEVSGFKEDIVNCNKRLDSLELRVDVLEQQRKESDSKLALFQDLEVKYNELKFSIQKRDQVQLSNDVEISNLPEDKGENTIHLVCLLATKLGVNIESTDIVSAERIGARRLRHSDTTTTTLAKDNVTEEGRPRPLVVRFARRVVRDEILREARVRRGATSSDLGIKSQPRRFYVNERLSRDNKILFSKARSCGRLNNWAFVWSKDGRIFARQGQGKPAHLIGSEKDLVNIFGSGSVGRT